MLVRRSPQAATLEGPQAPARARRLLRRHHRDLLGAAGRGPAHGRLAEADRLGRHRAHPVPRARRRQPRAHGRQHAEAGRAAGAGRGALHRHRRRGPRRPRRGRHDPRRGRRHRHRGRRRRHHRRVQAKLGKKIYRLLKFERSNQDTCINQKPRVNEGDKVQARATSSPTVPRPTTASWRWARTCSSPSCRGRATTSRTRSSSPSAW